MKQISLELLRGIFRNQLWPVQTPPSGFVRLNHFFLNFFLEKIILIFLGRKNSCVQNFTICQSWPLCSLFFNKCIMQWSASHSLFVDSRLVVCRVLFPEIDSDGLAPYPDQQHNWLFGAAFLCNLPLWRLHIPKMESWGTDTSWASTRYYCFQGNHPCLLSIWEVISCQTQQWMLSNW